MQVEHRRRAPGVDDDGAGHEGDELGRQGEVEVRARAQLDLDDGVAGRRRPNAEAHDLPRRDDEVDEEVPDEQQHPVRAQSPVELDRGQRERERHDDPDEDARDTMFPHVMRSQSRNQARAIVAMARGWSTGAAAGARRPSRCRPGDPGRAGCVIGAPPRAARS